MYVYGIVYKGKWNWEIRGVRDLGIEGQLVIGVRVVV